MPAAPASIERPDAAQASGAQVHSSRLLPSLFAGLNPRRLRVFEAGPANPETIRFLGQVQSRIHVVDLYSEPLVRVHQSELSEAEMKREFQQVLGFRVGTLIDVCLFWDVLNYLSRPALRAFSAALKPYVHPGTRAHGFSVLNVETPLRNQQYGILDESSISVRPGRREQLRYYPHSHEELNHCLSCFEVGRGWLLPDGRLEILLESVL
ncbi:MAG: hypothetical protein HKN58_01720 [Xanthomonadales bacterium]|nr:hypothetical protein [Xanthomonadales bacterium]